MAGLYIHIPFCRQKCHYCDFHFAVSLRHKKKVIAAITRELALRSREITKPFQSLYFGGGTPSVLETGEWREILETVHRYYRFEKDYEYTVEINPDDLTPSYMDFLLSMQVNRLSMGVQSFDDADLRKLNRSHTARQALQAVRIARDAGLYNINLDLIYGIPGSGDEVWNRNLEIFFTLDIPHLSAYALTVEKRTALWKFIEKGEFPAPDEDAAYRQYMLLSEQMKKAGYEHYEISNFSLPGYRSRHNSAYWQAKDYLGIGPSAHSYIRGKRYFNIANNYRYAKLLSDSELPGQYEVLSPSRKYNEYVMVHLRTSEGLSPDEIEKNFGKDFRRYLTRQSRKWIDDGKIIRESNTMRIPPEYWFISDSIIADLFYVE